VAKIVEIELFPLVLLCWGFSFFS